MSYESGAEPIKVGYLMDFLLSDDFPQDRREDLTNPFDMVFGEALRNGQLDRPVEIVYREVEGLPKGTGKAPAISGWFPRHRAHRAPESHSATGPPRVDGPRLSGRPRTRVR